MTERAVGSRYAISDRIGAGGMGEVYRGRVLDTGETVAIKVLNAFLTDDAESRARFIHEQGAMVQLHGAHIVSVRDLVVEGDTFAIVMELVHGSDMRAYMDRFGPFEPRTAAWLIAQVLDGLTTVHAAGIIHRDVKPENVLVGTDESGAPVLKLSDFGIARASDGPTLTQRNALIGTPRYMAPEHALAERPTTATDVYSAGIVLYELVAGVTPFAGGHPLAVLNRHVEVPPTRPDTMPLDLWDIVAAMLAKTPEARPDAATALEQVTAYAHGLPVPHLDTDETLDRTLRRDRVASAAPVLADIGSGDSGIDAGAAEGGGPGGGALRKLFVAVAATMVIGATVVVGVAMASDGGSPPRPKTEVRRTTTTTPSTPAPTLPPTSATSVTPPPTPATTTVSREPNPVPPTTPTTTKPGPPTLGIPRVVSTGSAIVVSWDPVGSAVYTVTLSDPSNTADSATQTTLATSLTFACIQDREYVATLRASGSWSSQPGATTSTFVQC